MATKKEQFELAMAGSYLLDVLQANDFSDEVMEESRAMLKKLKDNYSFREDDFYHPRITREEEIKDALKKIQEVGQRENVDYYLILRDKPEYSSEQQRAADLLYGIHFNEESGFTKRQFYLMAKYVSVGHELAEMAAGRIEGGDTLYNYMQEANNIVDELNTSSLKDFYQEHDFEAERAEHADVLEEMIAMGGYYHHYRSNSWYEPDEEDYDEEKYELARQFLTLDWELSNTFIDNMNHILEKAPILSDTYYAEKLVEAIETLDDRKFLVPTPIDKTLAKTIWENYRNDEIPPKERQAYFSMIVEADKMSNLLYHGNTSFTVMASDKEKIDKMVKDNVRLCFSYKFTTKVDISSKKVTILWDDKEKNISEDTHDEGKKIELIYDGTMEGLRKACKDFKKEHGVWGLKKAKYNFIEQMERDLNRAINEINHLPDILYSMQHMANTYIKTNGELIVPDIAKDMKIISETDMNDVLNGKDNTKYWEKITTNTLKRFVDSVNYKLMKYGNMYGDKLYKRPVAAKRVLKAYQVLNGMQPKNITPDYSQGNFNALRK